VRSNMAYAAGKKVTKITGNGAMAQRSDANSGMGSPRPANSAMAGSDMQDDAGIPDSDNSYAEL